MSFNFDDFSVFNERWLEQPFTGSPAESTYSTSPTSSGMQNIQAVAPVSPGYFSQELFIDDEPDRFLLAYNCEYAPEDKSDSPQPELDKPPSVATPQAIDSRAVGLADKDTILRRLLTCPISSPAEAAVSSEKMAAAPGEKRASYYEETGPPKKIIVESSLYRVELLLDKKTKRVLGQRKCERFHPILQLLCGCAIIQNGEGMTSHEISEWIIQLYPNVIKHHLEAFRVQISSLLNNSEFFVPGKKIVDTEYGGKRQVDIWELPDPGLLLARYQYSLRRVSRTPAAPSKSEPLRKTDEASGYGQSTVVSSGYYHQAATATPVAYADLVVPGLDVQQDDEPEALTFIPPVMLTTAPTESTRKVSQFNPSIPYLCRQAILSSPTGMMGRADIAAWICSNSQDYLGRDPKKMALQVSNILTSKKEFVQTDTPVSIRNMGTTGYLWRLEKSGSEHQVIHPPGTARKRRHLLPESDSEGSCQPLLHDAAPRGGKGKAKSKGRTKSKSSLPK